MITPSFALTATERVLPRMALDFTTASLDSRVTFTRAGNTATVVNSSGLIAPINANLPRFDYDPTTFVCKGLLIEEARTNSLVYSEQFDNVLWNKTDTTITANSINAPSGTQTADLATEGSAGSSNVAQAIAITANSTNTFSVFLKRGNTDWVRFVIWDSVNNANRISAWVNLSTGALGATVVNAGTSTGGVATTTNYGNGWYRVTLSGAVNNAAVLLNCLFSSAASDGVVTRISGATYYAWGAQTEAGAFATSYIPTVASTVTRTADVASMTGTTFSSWFNASQGTFVVYTAIPAFSQTTVRVSNQIFACDGTTDNFIKTRCFSSGTGNLNWNAVGARLTVTQFDTTSRTFSSINTTVKNAIAYKVNDVANSVNAQTVTTDNTVTLPTMNTLFIGSALGTLELNAQHIQKIFYFPQRLINAEVQAFSK
jgi:hypothetical protein